MTTVENGEPRPEGLLRPTTGNVIGGSHCDFNRKSAAPLRKISGAPLPMDRGQLLLANTANLLAKPQRQND